jgi:DNA replication protein DnaC
MNEIISWPYGPEGILAHGATGLGKTRCLILRLRTLHFKEHRSIKFIGAADLGLKCGQLFWEDQSKAAWFIEDLIRVDVLMLDDLDKARFTDRTEAELFHVIDARTANGKPILASLNTTGDELAAMLSQHRGLPLVRRLRDYCRAVDFDQS